jgi:hypothetical protein
MPSVPSSYIFFGTVGVCSGEKDAVHL